MLLAASFSGGAIQREGVKAAGVPAGCGGGAGACEAASWVVMPGEPLAGVDAAPPAACVGEGPAGIGSGAWPPVAFGEIRATEPPRPLPGTMDRLATKEALTCW